MWNMNSSGSLPHKFIIGLFGNEMIIYNRDGSVEKIIRCPDSYANGFFDAKTNKYLIASSTSGGDGIHILDFESDNWPKDFEEMETEGKLKVIGENLSTIKNMVNGFESPTYDSPSNHVLIIADSDPEELLEFSRKYSSKSLTFASYHTLTEKLDATYHRDKRMPYDMNGEQIIFFAENMEKQGNHFALWGGHGQALYMSLETMEGVLKAAYETFQAFIFAEVVMTNENMAKMIKEKYEPLAELCLKHGKKKIIFRNQRLFWNSNCYMDIWKDFLFNPKYREIIVPCMEETHCRTQDISLSGRVGLWLSGVFEHHAGRAVPDNSTFSRLWEWSDQQMQHHHLRAMVLHAALGADIFLLNLKKEGLRSFEPFFKMIETGALKIAKRHELLSISEVCLGMKKPSEAFHEHGNNARDTIGSITETECAVFDRLDWYWAGAPIREDDFCRYGFGSRDRMLNYMPINPYGFIASIPDEKRVPGVFTFKYKFSTDGEIFYDEYGKHRTAKEYRINVEEKLKTAARLLPVRLEGDVSWVVQRISRKHLRVVLIDPGYLNPKDRKVRVLLQNIMGRRAVDILSKEELPIIGNSIFVHVPQGVFRLIDIECEADIEYAVKEDFVS